MRRPAYAWAFCFAVNLYKRLRLLLRNQHVQLNYFFYTDTCSLQPHNVPCFIPFVCKRQTQSLHVFAFLEWRATLVHQRLQIQRVWKTERAVATIRGLNRSKLLHLLYDSFMIELFSNLKHSNRYGNTIICLAVVPWQSRNYGNKIWR